MRFVSLWQRILFAYHVNQQDIDNGNWIFTERFLDNSFLCLVHSHCRKMQINNKDPEIKYLIWFQEAAVYSHFYQIVYILFRIGAIHTESALRLIFLILNLLCVRWRQW